MTAAAIVTVIATVFAQVAMAQNPYQNPYGYGTTGYPYLNNWQYYRQLEFENQMRWQQMQQQQWALRQQQQRWPVLDFAEQAARLRVAKQQEEYYRMLNEQMRQGQPAYNPWIR